MVQFYFLSVLLTILVGLILISSDSSTELDVSLDIDEPKKGKGKKKGVSEDSDEGSFKIHDTILANETFCLITGALCTLIAFIKLFFTFGKNKFGIPVIGDLFPALLGIAGGLVVVLDYYTHSFVDHDLPEIIETVFFNNKKYIGFACIVVAVLHFIIPQVNFF